MKFPRERERTIDGGQLAVRIQFWWAKPRRSFVRFQSKHVYRNVFNPFRFAIEFLETTSPTALECLFCRMHGDRGSGRESTFRTTPSINGERESLVAALFILHLQV
jgi:hypothetical protein